MKGILKMYKKEGYTMKIITFILLFSITLGLSGISTYRTSIYTFAYYNDTESSPENIFIAGEIDFLLDSTNFTPTTTVISLSPNDLVQKIVTVLPENSNPFQYTASTTNFSGDNDFCSALSVDADVEGTDMFDGLLSDMLTGTTTILDSWNYSIGMGTNNFQNSICNFDTEYFGSQTRHNYNLGEGYNDTEFIENTIASWGFRLNKIYYDVDREIIIDPEINKCEARSQGYWGNNEGCSLGTGSSDWETEINDLSNSLSGVFGSSSGYEICGALHIPLCPSGGTTEGKLCRAENKLLADELNIVSGKVDINAIIAGADDGDNAFDTLGLTSLSRISAALTAIENVLINENSTDSEITDAGYVAERIYTFYEDENPEAPMCLYDEEYLESFVLKEVEGDNEWVEIYNQTNVPIDINGWEICDNTSCDILSASGPIPAGGYGLIVATTTTASNILPTFWYLPTEIVEINIPDSKIGNGLSNNEDMLILKRPDGVIIDQMNYGDVDMGWNNYNTDVWNPGAPDVAEGNVLARNPSGYDTNEPSDWYELIPPSVDLIFPGQVVLDKWYWGETYTILWDAVNNNGGDDSELDMDILYIQDINQDSKINDGDVMTSITTDTVNDGEYDWTVPSGFIGYMWVYLVATGPENPMLNTAQLSGEIWDPLPLFIGSAEEESLMELSSVDTEAPVITITGNNPALLELGASYNDLGAIVTDNVNPNIGVNTENFVDTSILGEYQVIYTATDQAGNIAEAVRTVIVYDPAVGPPVIEEPVADETSTTTEQVVEVTTSSAPTTETSTTTQETTVPEPVVEETATTTEKVAETTTSTEPVAEIATSTEPVIETATTTEPIAETATSTEPIVETATTTEPVIETATSTEPTIETSTTTPATEEPEPVVDETSTTTEPVIETATTTEKVVEDPITEEPESEPEPELPIIEEPALIEDPPAEIPIEDPIVI